MTLYLCSKSGDELEHGMRRSHQGSGGAIRHRLVRRYEGMGCQPLKRRGSPLALLVATAAIGGITQTLAPPAHAAPAPEAEYLYNVTARRHYNFPSNDALSYGHGICDKVSQGENYAQVMSDVKSDVTPNDEFAANYLVSYAVNLLCPDRIGQLRNSAAHCQPPVG